MIRLLWNALRWYALKHPKRTRFGAWVLKVGLRLGYVDRDRVTRDFVLPIVYPDMLPEERRAFEARGGVSSIENLRTLLRDSEALH